MNVRTVSLRKERDKLRNSLKSWGPLMKRKTWIFMHRTTTITMRISSSRKRYNRSKTSLDSSKQLKRQLKKETKISLNSSRKNMKATKQSSKRTKPR